MLFADVAEYRATVIDPSQLAHVLEQAGNAALASGGVSVLILPGDLGVRRGAAALGLPATPAALTARAARWRPWRAYAVQHLWATTDHPINHWPTLEEAS